MLQLLPGKDGTMMNLRLIKLGRRSGKDRINFALVEALAVTMKEGDVTDAGPAILNYGCGMEFGHGFMVLMVLCKVTVNYDY